MCKLHQSLDEQLVQLETERDHIAEAIRKVHSRIEILDEVMSWRLPEDEDLHEVPQEYGFLDGDAEVISEKDHDSGGGPVSIW